MKRCSQCKADKPATPEFFNRDRANKDGLVSRCRECAKDYYQSNKTLLLKKQRASKYQITLSRVEALMSSCEVCGSTQRLHIDHDHTTNSVRGVLCHGCNVALGFVDESPVRLRRLAEYIERHSIEEAA